MSPEEWQQGVSLVREDVPDPPPPMPLLFIPVVMAKKTHFALLDSGASDSFVSLDVVQQAGLRLLPLKDTIKVRVANGQTLNVQHFVRVHAAIGDLKLKLFLRVISTPLPIVLGTLSVINSTQ